MRFGRSARGLQPLEAAGLVVNVPLRLLAMTGAEFRAWLKHAWTAALSTHERAALKQFLPSGVDAVCAHVEGCAVAC